MLGQIELNKILFIDIETVPGCADYAQLPDRLKILWDKKSRVLLRRTSGEPCSEQEIAELYLEKAGIFAEFGRIICISVGFLTSGYPDKEGILRIKSFSGDISERDLLLQFTQMIHEYYHDPQNCWLCGHNIKEFDIPYLCRRLIVNEIPLPEVLQLAGKKPWEMKHLLDTMDLWKFGDLKGYISLDLLAAVLDVETPKGDIDGSMVGHVFWTENDIHRITVYCEKDVLTVVRILHRMMGIPQIRDERVVFVREEIQ